MALTAWGPNVTSLKPSSLPAAELARDRYPFDASPIDGLRAANPGVILIGDSMALRVDPDRLAALEGRPVVPLVRLATGSAHWYLLLKNYVVASGVKPAWVVVFFRDTQLTDPLWRLLGKDRFSIDHYSLDSEPELNRVVEANIHNPWYQFHARLDRIFAVERTRDWLEPALTNAISRTMAGSQSHDDFTGAMNGLFGLGQLRVMNDADMGEADEAATAFASRAGSSTLPLMIDLARSRGMPICFVRVLRRPEDGRPPRESTSLRRYVHDLREYVVSRGALMFDDRDEPALAALAYDDGDHILDPERPKYTDVLYRRLASTAR